MLLLILQYQQWVAEGYPSTISRLDLFPHDFIIALRLWLGIPFFPLLPLRTCLFVIDPAYFDLSVRCTTEPSFISSAASQAGVAAAVSEEAKDDHYLETVSDHGGEFIPLVCESFGV